MPACRSGNHCVGDVRPALAELGSRRRHKRDPQSNPHRVAASPRGRRQAPSNDELGDNWAMQTVPEVVPACKALRAHSPEPEKNKKHTMETPTLRESRIAWKRNKEVGATLARPPRTTEETRARDGTNLQAGTHAGRGGVKSSRCPGERQNDHETDRGEPMTSEEATRYKAMAARCNLLKRDRPDIQHAANGPTKLSRRNARPFAAPCAAAPWAGGGVHGRPQEPSAVCCSVRGCALGTGDVWASMIGGANVAGCTPHERKPRRFSTRRPRRAAWAAPGTKADTVKTARWVTESHALAKSIWAIYKGRSHSTARSVTVRSTWTASAPSPTCLGRNWGREYPCASVRMGRTTKLHQWRMRTSGAKKRAKGSNPTGGKEKERGLEGRSRTVLCH